MQCVFVFYLSACRLPASQRARARPIADMATVAQIRSDLQTVEAFIKAQVDIGQDVTELVQAQCASTLFKIRSLRTLSMEDATELSRICNAVPI